MLSFAKWKSTMIQTLNLGDLPVLLSPGSPQPKQKIGYTDFWVQWNMAGSRFLILLKWAAQPLYYAIVEDQPL